VEESEKLNLFIEAKVRMRSAQEQVLRDLNLTWKSLDALEAEVIDTLPADGITRDGYRVAVEERIIYKYKPDLMKYPIGTDKSVRVHQAHQ
jgi:hypothetical protein